MSTRVQFIKFALIGVLNTIVHYLVFLFLFRVVGSGMIAASAFGYMVGMTCSFILNRTWTFKVTGPGIRTELVKFFFVNLLSLGVNLLVLQVLVTVMKIIPEFAQVGAIVFTLGVNFSGNKWWTFRKGNPKVEE